MQALHSRDDTPDRAGAALRTFFARPGPLLLATLAAGFGGWRLWLGNWGWQDAAIALGLFVFWPLLEWLIHVFMLHYKPLQLGGRRIDFLLPRTHREHHADPWWLDRVFIPGHIFPLVLPPLLIAVWLLAPGPEAALSWLAVFFLFALNYEWTHYLAHIRWSPPIGYYQRRVRAHRLHHFRNENLWWGVSRGEADWLLRTAPAVDDTDATGTTKKLAI